MELNNKALTAIVAVALILGTVGFFNAGPQGIPGLDGKDAVGGAVGPEKFEHQVFRQNATTGGDRHATTSTDSLSSYVLLSSELNENTSSISWNNGLNLTLTTMASTSRPFVGLRQGEFFTVMFFNASTTAAATITFAAGTGVDLQEDEGETVIINGLEMARLTFLKKEDTDIAFWVEAGQVGD